MKLRKAFAGWHSSGIAIGGSDATFCSGKRKAFVVLHGSHAKECPCAIMHHVLDTEESNHKFMINRCDMRELKTVKTYYETLLSILQVRQ